MTHTILNCPICLYLDNLHQANLESNSRSKRSYHKKLSERAYERVFKSKRFPPDVCDSHKEYVIKLRAHYFESLREQLFERKQEYEQTDKDYVAMNLKVAEFKLRAKPLTLMDGADDYNTLLHLEDERNRLKVMRSQRLRRVNEIRRRLP